MCGPFILIIKIKIKLISSAYSVLLAYNEWGEFDFIKISEVGWLEGGLPGHFK